MVKKVDWHLLNENYGANLCPYAFHFDADYTGFMKEFGIGVDFQAVGMENGFLRQAYDLDSYKKFTNYIFKKLNTDKAFSKNMLKRLDKIFFKFHEFNKAIVGTDLGQLDDEQLAQLFEQFYTYFYEMSTWGVPFSFTEYGTPLWTNHLQDHLRKLKIENSEQLFQFLSTSDKRTFTAREKEDLLRLTIEAKNNTIVRDLLFAGKYDELPPDFKTKLEKHEAKYCWVNFGFDGPLLRIDHFTENIVNWLKKDPEDELKRVLDQRNQLATSQKKDFKKHKVSKKHKQMFKRLQEFGFRKAFRKDIECHSFYVYDTCLLKEVGKRLGYPASQGHYLLIDEITSMLRGGKKLSRETIRDRMKNCFYVVEKGQARLITGQECVEFIKGIKHRQIPKDLKDLKGQCACKGRVKGAVKIIRGKEDYSKFNQGDILVTYATNPNMVPLMKMASAIITDEGGVTCHAAIVSRELGVPCVIGTRFATKILKDGEQVEVFADKGNVMRMKQEEFFMFEQIFGISPLDTISYAWSLEEDLLDRYFVKDLGMKGYPTARLMGVFTGDKADLFYASDIMALGQFMLKKAVADPNWPMFANKDNRNKSSAIFRYADKLLKMDISKLNDEELADLYDEYNELHRRMHESGWFGNILDYDGIFYNHLFELIDKRIKKRGLDLSPQETLQKLTLASDLSFGQKEEIAFLDIVKEAKASGAEAEQVLQMIEQHTQKWFWLSFGFAGHGWRQDHFEDKLKEMVATEFDAQKLKQEILEKPSQIIADKKKLAKMLKLDNSDLKLLKSFADICFLKGYRKDSMFFGNVARFKILKEISKRARVPMNFLRYTLPEETRQIIMTKKADLEDLRQRVNYTVMHFESNKPMKYLWGEEAKKYYESLNIREVEIKEIDELKGMCASVGQAKGRVAIINRPEEMTKINKGDILVSEATMPDLMPAIKKAAAIVTNVGGITCHAAIVSRELGIPCVIGTKIATKALKDGDMIEVDADNGLVKKV